MRKNGRRGVSFGTVAVLTFTLLILAGSVFVWTRLSSGKTVDLSRLKIESLDLTIQTGAPEEIRADAQQAAPSPAPTAAQAAKTPEPAAKQQKSFTLTAAGTVALEGEVRKNSYYSDSKQYDYYDIMMLLRKELQSDLNIVFAENMFSEEEKGSDLTAPGAGAAMLKAAGFNAAACGFYKAFGNAEAGIASTRKLLNEHGIRPIGIYERDGAEEFRIGEVGGVRTALLQYTDTIAAATRKTMAKNGQSGMVPAADAEAIGADIARAREKGAEAVIVLLNWGKTGKGPDKNMRSLAQEIADAGADLIIGNGSRAVSGAEMLTSAADGKQVLCVWSLGTTLSGDRSGIKRMAGMLLQVSFTVENGETKLTDARYIPLYTWKYKQDGRFYYRCIASDGGEPDGMDAEQQKMMSKALDTVRAAMKDTPVEERTVDE